MADRPSLGRAIRTRRQALGLTREALAARVGEGVRQSDISRLERDQITLPLPARVRALARALELPAGELLVRAGWTGADQPLAAPGERADPDPSSAPPPELAWPEAGPTRLGQVRETTQRTARATARALAQADLIWAWATDPLACRQPFAAFAAHHAGQARARPPDQGRDSVSAEGTPALGGGGPDEHGDPHRR